jgi:hypothetical protein
MNERTWGAVHTTEVVGLRSDVDRRNWKYFFDLLQPFFVSRCGGFRSAFIYHADYSVGNELSDLGGISETLAEDESIHLRHERGTVSIGFQSGWRQIGASNGPQDWSLEFGYWNVDFDRRVNDVTLNDFEAEQDLIELWSALLPANPYAAAAGEETCLASDWEAILAGQRSLVSHRDWCIAVVADTTASVPGSRPVPGGQFIRRAFLFKECYNRS